MAALLATGLFIVTSTTGEDFAPGEEILSPGVADIAAGTGEAPFPRTDVSRFDGSTEVVRVYLRVEELPPGRRMTATVERYGRSSALSRFFGGGIRAEGGGEDRLSVSQSGVSGVVSFAVRAEDALPAGEYAVEVRSVRAESGEETLVLARKYFVVGDRQA
ncbi:hypothetical protein GBA63_08575 [Rubrobacter tropicus]|uniref:Uncharacterized protein n=1 Tax=Rubrobacter tropicus TaxID=2653851 RepID=A0A6G8Q8C8_9ACTN|nr:hypothetical protein [Rubrobacter tropicus]QIN82692.1 hypothetical protein GBA63_08575 [Rubrobacter tropicus]